MLAVDYILICYHLPSVHKV